MGNVAKDSCTQKCIEKSGNLRQKNILTTRHHQEGMLE